MKLIDRFLNRITMYRLVVYTLGTYVSLSIVFAFMGRLSFSPTALVGSLLLIITSAYLTDRIFGRILRIPTNTESALITSLILFLIVQPAHTAAGCLALILAGVVSSASKFLIAWNGKHIFNPAALAAAVLSLSGLQATTWWVGSTVFWPVTLLLGLAIVRKIRRLALWASFTATSIVVQYLVFVAHHQPIATSMQHALIASPLIFLGTVMLTEPATMPPRRGLQMWFGAMVAVLYVLAWSIGPLTIYPEVALLLGNIFAWAVSPKFRVRLELHEVQRLSPHIYNYVFKPDRQFSFIPGQYMEWTLPDVPYDNRGNRRTFTIASSPTEPEVMLGVKFYEPASMYKAVLEQMQPGDTMYASQLAGNFTLSGNERKKLVFIAGGIGITPFRSMVKYLSDTQKQVDIVLLYAVSDPSEFAYINELQSAASIGVRLVPIVTGGSVASTSYLQGRVDAELIGQLVPDYAERTYYISGPNAMVDASKDHLHALSIPDTRIRTDHFSGY